MPSFALSSEVRDSTDGLQLVLRARHVFVAGSPSKDAHTIKGRLPDDVDVILESDLVIAVAGMANRAQIDACKVQHSAIANHLLHYFHMNGEQLGVRPASKIFVDESDGVAKFTLAPTRPILSSGSASAVRLSAIELLYITRTPPLPGPQRPRSPNAHIHADAAAAADPFTPHAFLPLIAGLDRIVEKFAVYHLVRRYPLIFGPWRQRYDVEIAASLKLARAVTDVIARSPHSQFRRQSQRLLKRIQQDLDASNTKSKNALQGLVQASRAVDDTVSQPVSDSESELHSSTNDFDILCRSMERLFKFGMKPIRYKSVSSSAIHGGTAKASKEDEFTLSACRSESPPAIFRGVEEDGERTGLLPGLDLDLDLDLDDDAWGRDELSFDENAEPADDSQELELGDDLFFSSDEDGLVSGNAGLGLVDTEDVMPEVDMADDFGD
ncbi:hypothetical protein C8Q77DRAFT_1197416, partial [Trametes polyzona]